MKLQIIDNNSIRHEKWEELKIKYSTSLTIDYNSYLSPISINILKCDLLLIHMSNDKERDYYYKNKDNSNLNVIFFGGGIPNIEYIDDNWYFPVSKIEKIFKNIKEYI